MTRISLLLLMLLQFLAELLLMKIVIYLFIYCCSDNSKLCSCGGDRQIFYWDVATGRVIRKFRGHDSEVEYFFVLPYTTSQLLQLCFIDFLGIGLKLIVVDSVICYRYICRGF